MTKYIAFIILCICVFQYCKKPEGDDLSGELEVKGKLVLNDTLNGVAEEVVLPDHIIKIKTDPAAESFLFQVKTNSSGLFTITNLSAKTYYLYAEKKNGDLLYAATMAIDPDTQNDDVKLILYPAAPDYNILSFIVKDSSSIPVSPMYNANICLFRSRQLAEQGKCDSAVWAGPTDKSGRAQTSKLAAGWYYISSTFTSGSVSLVKKDSVLVTEKGIIQKEIFLTPAAQPFAVSGEIFINDTLSGFSEEIPLESQMIIVKKDAERDNQQFVQQVTSNAHGVFAIGGLPAGSWSLQAEKTIANILYTDTVTVNSPVYTKMVLYPSAKNYNILQVIVRDSATQGLLNNAKVCIFSNRRLAEINDCDGSFVSDYTNNYGRFITTRLTPAKYYINAQLAIGNDTLSVKDSVEIKTVNGIIQTSVWLK